MKREKSISEIVISMISHNKGLSVVLALLIVFSIITGILPPLVLERIIDTLAGDHTLSAVPILIYFLLLSLSGILDAGKESVITIFGQKVTHRIRSCMCRKLNLLPADYYTRQDTGTTVSRFVNDVDTVETLFTSGIISMIADTFRILSILAVIFVKSPGLGILLLLVLPLLYLLTRVIQKRMFAAQLDNRRAVGRANNHIPDTVHSIRMIHNLHREAFMEKRYDRYIQDGFHAMNRVNFYDAVYSPIILTVSAVLIAVMMTLSARGDWFLQFFGMSVGTAVAIISYVGKIFEPLENIGMEIQNIQAAAAGIHRINTFLKEDDDAVISALLSHENKNRTCLRQNHDADDRTPAICLKNICFGYEPDREILRDFSLTLAAGENVTLVGRTGTGKSTVFKLVMGLYRPWHGTVQLYGRPADEIPESERRSIFGYVEQRFRAIPGTILDQITLNDQNITREQVIESLQMVGLWKTVQELPQQLDTEYRPPLFSQGQIQLLSIARAVVSDPQILLLDEITANLDSDTERRVLDALQAASLNRTVLSISHRIYENNKTPDKRIVRLD